MGRSKGQVWLVDMGMVAGCKDLVKDSWGADNTLPRRAMGIKLSP